MVDIRQTLDPQTTDEFSRSLCLAGTRIPVQDRMIKWAFSDTEDNILWLRGVAGSGKSTLALTAGRYFRGVGHLGACLVFERAKSEPSAVLRTLLFQLTVFDSTIAKHIRDDIEAIKKVMGTSANEQRDALLGPLLAAAELVPGPIVIVLDALDECGTPEGRRDLLQVLVHVLSELPPKFRFLVTSRPERDIQAMFRRLSAKLKVIELDHTSNDSREDVRLLVCTEMDRIREDIEFQGIEPPPGWSWDRAVDFLCEAAGGLFIWASTAMKLIANSTNPLDSLEEFILNRSGSPTSTFTLDELYATVLRGSGIVWSKGRFSKILGLILVSKVPLAADEIDRLLDFPAHKTCKAELSCLQSVLSTPMQGPVTLSHTSFSDYLLAPERNNDPWCINISVVHQFLAHRCFVLMGALRFNMCDFPSSFLLNSEVPGLDECVKREIALPLEYACRFWSDHLAHAPLSEDLVANLSHFAHNQLLFWFEALSLLKAFSLAGLALLYASQWAAVRVDPPTAHAAC